MSLLKFDLDTLKELDGGRVPEAFRQAVQRVINDCTDRPGLADPRKVVMELAIIPVKGEGGLLEGVAATFQISDAIPKRKTKAYSFGIRQGTDGKQKMIFSTEDPHNVSQLTFGDVDPETGRAVRQHHDDEEE